MAKSGNDYVATFALINFIDLQNGFFQRTSHGVRTMSAHLVCATKYCYPVLKGDIQRSTRSLQIHSCNKEMVQHLRESGIKHSF
jgi:hypothetical protein